MILKKLWNVAIMGFSTIYGDCWRRYKSLAILIIISALLTGCTATMNTNKSLGKIEESNDVTGNYRSYDINPGYNYFYYGSEQQPDAIMGIRKDYNVQSEFWKQIRLTKEQLEYWVIWGERQRSGEGFSRRYSGYQGAYILDPHGSVIGDWYSKKDFGVFYFPEARVMIPYPPANQGGSSNKPCS